MKAIRVNADYELVLSGKTQTPPLINHSLEFFALYLEDRPLYSSKVYSPDFLNHVENITGTRPGLVQAGEFENWWGPLDNLSLEKKLNSKEFSAAFAPGSKIIKDITQISLEEDRTYLAKGILGMSGQDFLTFKKGEEDKLQSLLNKVKVLVIEPLYARSQDFSHYVFSNGEEICYENLINSSFQYKGTLFNNLSSPGKEGLRFFHKVSSEEWSKMESALDEVKRVYGEERVFGGFSIDSFTYHEGIKKIKTVSEVNYRKTMGLMTWLLSKRYSGKNSWSLMVLGKPNKKNLSFSDRLNQIKEVSFDSMTRQGVLLLSPGDTRFDVFFLTAENASQGIDLYQSLRKLLPDSELPVLI